MDNWHQSQLQTLKRQKICLDKTEIKFCKKRFFDKSRQLNILWHRCQQQQQQNNSRTTGTLRHLTGISTQCQMSNNENQQSSSTTLAKLNFTENQSNAWASNARHRDPWLVKIYNPKCLSNRRRRKTWHAFGYPVLGCSNLEGKLNRRWQPAVFTRNDREHSGEKTQTEKEIYSFRC